MFELKYTMHSLHAIRFLGGKIDTYSSEMEWADIAYVRLRNII